MDRTPPARHTLAVVFGSALLLSFSPLSAQRITGNVREEGTSAPIASARIVILDDKGREMKSSITDSEGWFLLAVAAPGDYTLRVTHVAYTDYGSERIGLARGETVEVEVWMGHNVIPLEPLVVTARNETAGRLAEFHSRLKTNAFGRFIAREDIENRPTARVTDLLRTEPGVRILSARRGAFETPIVALRGVGGNCLPSLYVDGLRIRQSPDTPLDDLLTPDMLEGVEIYSTTAGAPAHYQAESSCGVVLFWTRQGEPGKPFSWKRLIAGIGVLGLVIILAK